MNRHLRTALGLAITVSLLAWALRDVSISEVAREIGRADPLLFVLGIVIAIAGFAVRAVRWGILLKPLGLAVPFGPRFVSVIIGFAANNVLPARIGEIARALTLSRITPVPVGAAFASLVVERIFDAVVLVGFLFATMAGADFPAIADVGGVDPKAAARLVAIGMLGLTVVLFAMVVAPARFVRGFDRATARLPVRWQTAMRGGFGTFLSGLGVLRDARLFMVSLLLALFQWWFTAWSFLVTMRAFSIDDVPFSGAIFLQSLLSLAVSIPSSPGFFGPFEAAATFGLSVWDVAPEKAVPFAVGLHLGGFIPVTLLGFYFLARLNLSWREVGQKSEAVTA